MRLANLHHSNIGGLLLEAFYSHQHSWWFIVAKAPMKAGRMRAPLDPGNHFYL